MFPDPPPPPTHLHTHHHHHLHTCRVRSLPPVMLYTMPVARSIDRSISGAEVAACAQPDPGGQSRGGGQLKV